MDDKAVKKDEKIIDIRPKDMLQLNATLIAGVLIFASFINFAGLYYKPQNVYPQFSSILSTNVLFSVVLASNIYLHSRSIEYAFKNKIDKSIIYFKAGIIFIILNIVVITLFSQLMSLPVHS